MQSGYPECFRFRFPTLATSLTIFTHLATKSERRPHFWRGEWAWTLTFGIGPKGKRAI